MKVKNKNKSNGYLTTTGYPGEWQHNNQIDIEKACDWTQKGLSESPDTPTIKASNRTRPQAPMARAEASITISDTLDNLPYALYARQDAWLVANRLSKAGLPPEMRQAGENLKRNIKNIALIVHKDALLNGELQLSAAEGDATMDFFKNQVQVTIHENAATGVLVKADTLLTSGHLVSKITKEKVVDYRAVFNFYLDEDGNMPKLEIYNILKCEHATYIENTEGGLNTVDLAVLKLDKTATEKETALPVLAENPIDNGTEVYCLGFGWAQPMKISLNAMTFFNQSYSIRTKLITRPGNSGSPLFNAATHELVGILFGTNKEMSLSAGGPRISQDVTGYDGSVYTKIHKNNNSPFLIDFYNLIK